jgi:hypothetical protein
MLASATGSGRRTPIAALCANFSLARGPRGTNDCRHEHEPQHLLHPVPHPVASELSGGEQ